MTNIEILLALQKAGISTTSGGLMPPEATSKFIQTTVDSSEFLKAITTEKNIKTTRYLDTLGVSSRLMNKATEGVAPSNVRGITNKRRSLTPVEVILPYDISINWLEENIQGQSAEDAVNQAFAMQFSNDLNDLAISGDTAVDADDPDKAFLEICDGWAKRIAADNGTHHYARAGSTDWKGVVFPNLLKALPEKFKVDPSKLMILTNFDAESEYRDSLATRNTALGDSMLTEKRLAQYKGIEVRPVPGIAYGTNILTMPKNLAIGFGRDFTVYRQLQPRTRTIEYTITAKVDANYALSDQIAYTI